MKNKTTILTSIKKEYAEKIFDGMKKYEFRRGRIGKWTNRVYVYESKSNVKDKIIGYFDTEPVEPIPVIDILNYIRTHKEEAGIEYDKAKKYFEGKEYGYMYPIHDYTKFRINQFKIFGEEFKAPQSFFYVDDDVELKMYNEMIKGISLKQKLNTYSTKEFPNLQKDMRNPDNQYYKTDEGYVVINKIKNKIVRIEKQDKQADTIPIIQSAIKNLDGDKPIYVNVPAKRKKLLDRFVKSGFELETIYENKYSKNDLIVKMVRNI